VICAEIGYAKLAFSHSMFKNPELLTRQFLFEASSVSKEFSAKLSNREKLFRNSLKIFDMNSYTSRDAQINHEELETDFAQALLTVY
jgi:hypothetical protein